MEAISLRVAGESDLELTLAWRELLNEYQAPGGPPESWENHINWFRGRTTRMDYIIIFEGRRVGTVALIKMTDDKSEISVHVAEKSLRGKGVGSIAVQLGMRQSRNMGVGKVIANIHILNHSSKQFFYRLGYQPPKYQRDAKFEQWIRPLHGADCGASLEALVVLQGGEDTEGRCADAISAWCASGKERMPILISGNDTGQVEEQKSIRIGKMAEIVMSGTGVHPCADYQSMNTADHPPVVIGWIENITRAVKHVGIITSETHANRAWLTFRKADPDSIYCWHMITSFPSGSPAEEEAKIDRYGLREWEQSPIPS